MFYFIFYQFQYCTKRAQTHKKCFNGYFLWQTLWIIWNTLCRLFYEYCGNANATVISLSSYFIFQQIFFSTVRFSVIWFLMHPICTFNFILYSLFCQKQIGWENLRKLKCSFLRDSISTFINLFYFFGCVIKYNGTK